jgi:hypothetical protein
MGHLNCCRKCIKQVGKHRIPDAQWEKRIWVCQSWATRVSHLLHYYSNRLGYEASSGLVARLTGSAQLSSQGYLEKHQGEIIDYKRRQATGKTIGSGRMEKAIDQVIGHHQKRKGMSWRPEGSRALALLKVLELNGGWQDFWFPSTIG